MQKLQGWVEQGNTIVLKDSSLAVQTVQGSFPGATVTVYNAGLLTLATIYSDNLPTPTLKPSSFTADANGNWFFYAPNGRYDVRFSGIAVPFTLGDFVLFDQNDTGGSTGGGGSVLPGVPSDLVITGIAAGLKVTSTVIARSYNATVDRGEFRAAFVAAGTTLPGFYDMRTPAEGGTFVHNGTTKLIITGVYATALGAQYVFTSPADGRWFFAWRLHNTIGWSLWSDGNVTPSKVGQGSGGSGGSGGRGGAGVVDTNPAATADTGPPSGWTVTLELGPTPNTVIVHATRPLTNGKILYNWGVQIKDGSTGTWQAMDANAGPSATHYDGSAIAHSLVGNVLTRSFGSGFSTAVPGDVVLIDVRGGAYSLPYCTTAIIETVGLTNLTLYSAPNPLPLVSVDLRIKVVSAAWAWSTGGYLGAQANHGYWDSVSGGAAASIFGDQTTQEFISPPIDIPGSVSQPEARVWFTNDYSVNDDSVNHSTGLNAAGVLSSASWTDFRDQNVWRFIRGIPGCANFTLLSSGLTITGAEAFNNAKLRRNFCGVVSRGLFFPDPVTNILQVRITLDSFVNPTDQDTSNRIFAWGVGFFGPSMNDAYDYSLALFGKKGAASAIYSELYNYPPTGVPAVKASGGSDVVADGAAVTIKVTIGTAAYSANENAVAINEVVWAGSVSHTLTLTGSAPLVVTQAMGGINIALGMFQQHLTNVGSMRITKFELLTGRYFSK